MTIENLAWGSEGKIVRKGIAEDIINSTPTQKIKDMIPESDLDIEYSGFGRAYLDASHGFGREVTAR